MNYISETERISMILYALKIFFINVGTFIIFLKLSGKTCSKIMKVVAIVFMIFPTIVFEATKEQLNPINAMIIMLLILMIIIAKTTQSTMGYTIIMTVISIGISNVLFFVSIVINGLPNMIFKVKDDRITFVFILLIYFALVYHILKIKKLKNGLFIDDKSQSEYMDSLVLNIGVIILFSLEIYGNYDILQVEKMGVSIAFLSAIMFLVIQKSFKAYYKQKLLYRQLEETNNELNEKQKEIEKLEQENLSFSKRSHSLAHKQKSLEYKINKLLMNEETAEELDLQERVKELSKEVYQRPIEDLDKTGIQKVDDMLQFMQSECTKSNINFNLQIIGNVYHIINNIITEEQLEILIADHIKDAIIAIKHSDNINKSILVKLGKIDEYYGLYIYDSGIEFENETLINLGKKPSTTHKDEGGTGMGFMNTFDTLKSCGGSLVITEIGKPSKENFTKIVKIKFDNKNEFKVETYKEGRMNNSNN